MATATTTRFPLLIGLGPLVRAVAAPAATAAPVECDKPLATGRLPSQPRMRQGAVQRFSGARCGRHSRCQDELLQTLRRARARAQGRWPLVERASTLAEEREMLLPVDAKTRPNTHMRPNLSRSVLRDSHRRLEIKDPRGDAVHQHGKGGPGSRAADGWRARSASSARRFGRVSARIV